MKTVGGHNARVREGQSKWIKKNIFDEGKQVHDISQMSILIKLKNIKEN